jgi:hypothetical protein
VANSSKTDLAIALVCAGVLVVANTLLFAVGTLPVRREGIPDWPQTLVVITGVVMTIAIFSFLYRDNPFFRAAENLFVGLGLGISLAVTWYSFFKPEVYDILVVPAFTPGMTVGRSNLLLLIPIGLGLMILLRMSRSYGWVSRYPMAFLVGYYSGFSIQPTIHSNIIKQMQETVVTTPMPWMGWAVVGLAVVLLAATAYFASKGGRLSVALKIASGALGLAYVIARTTGAPQGPPVGRTEDLAWALFATAAVLMAAAGYFASRGGKVGAWLWFMGGTAMLIFLVNRLAAAFARHAVAAQVFASMDSIIILLGVFSVLCYFVFSLEHRGVVGALSRAGIIFLMVAFGASFGYAVMARESLVIGRFQFLLGDWLHLLQ